MKNSNQQTYIIIIILVILTSVIVGGLVYFLRQQEINKIQKIQEFAESSVASTENIEIDNSNTIVSPTGLIENNISPAVTAYLSPASSDSDKELIAQAFAQKYGRPVIDVILTISKNTGTHASGGVKFSSEGAGGMRFAYKSGDVWKIAFDGNGSPTCENIKPNNFPREIISECWDQEQNKLVTW